MNFPKIFRSNFYLLASNSLAVFPRSSSDYYVQILDGPRDMINFVIVLVSCVRINIVMHVHIMAWIVGPCLFHSPNEVICQYTVLPSSLW